MRNRTFPTALLLLALLGGLGAAEPGKPAGTAPEIMPVSQLRPGMKGYGLTSLEGTEAQRFEIEVLGTFRGWAPKGDLILIRMKGPVIDETGIISGMSGSPVFVNDKLVGAVAYGWLYCKIPLAGVTPAAEMMKVEKMPDEGEANEARAERDLARLSLMKRSAEVARSMLAGPLDAERRSAVRACALRLALPDSLARRASRALILPPGLRRALPAGIEGALQPLPIPVAISGPPGGADWLAGLFAGSGFVPVQAAAASGGLTEKDVAAELRPGVSVGAAFVTGDMDITGMGTLTWIDGDRAVAFGHPMFGSGRTDVPMVIGRVQAIVPSLSNSFKLATAGPVVGRIVQDRDTAIVARLGQKAPTFPCRVRVKGTLNDEFNYRVTGYWELAPMFTMLALGASSARWEGEGNRYTLTARASIWIDGREAPLRMQNVYNSYSVVPPAVDLVVMPMESLLTNPYRDVQVTKVDYELEVRSGFKAALIETAWPDRTSARPGSKLTVYVRLLRFRGERSVLKVVVPVPETAKPGSTAQVLVCGAMANRMVKRSLDPGFFAPRDFESLLRMIEQQEPNTNVAVRASFVRQGVRYRGEAMPSLPSSALSVLSFGGEGGDTAPLITDFETSVPTPYVIEGSHTFSVNIEQPEPYNP